jgi:gas vesicle protein
MHGGSFLAGLLVGALAASAATLFYAPMPGRKMRKRVSSQMRDMSDDLQDQALERAAELQKNAQKMWKEQNRMLQRQAHVLSAQAQDRAYELQNRGQKVLKERSKRLGLFG